MAEEITGRILRNIREDLANLRSETADNTAAIRQLGMEVDGLRLEIGELRHSLSQRLSTEMRDHFNKFERRIEQLLDRRESR